MEENLLLPKNLGTEDRHGSRGWCHFIFRPTTRGKGSGWSGNWGRHLRGGNGSLRFSHRLSSPCIPLRSTRPGASRSGLPGFRLPRPSPILQPRTASSAPCTGHATQHRYRALRKWCRRSSPRVPLSPAGRARLHRPPEERPF